MQEGFVITPNAAESRSSYTAYPPATSTTQKDLSDTRRTRVAAASSPRPSAPTPTQARASISGKEETTRSRSSMRSSRGSRFRGSIHGSRSINIKSLCSSPMRIDNRGLIITAKQLLGACAASPTSRLRASKRPRDRPPSYLSPRRPACGAVAAGSARLHHPTGCMADSLSATGFSHTRKTHFSLD